MNSDPILQAENSPKEPQKQSALASVFDYLELFAWSVFVIMMLFTLAFRICRVDGSSMENTLYNGERILIHSIGYTPRQDDIVVFHLTEHAGAETLVKRVIATGGQELVIDFKKCEIYVDGVSVRENPLACKGKIAYIPDNPDLYGYMSGIQYLNFIADVFKVAADVRETRIHQYAADFELTEALAQPIATYSHGMKQKLAVIAALIHEPKLMIMDEPFVGLDPKAAHTLKTMMRDLCARGGAIFFSTHVLEVAEKLCDKIAIIKGGKLIKEGTMDEVKGDLSLENVFLELV